MSRTLVLLWLGATNPGPSERAALHDWSSAEHVKLEAPRRAEPASSTTETYSDVTARALEELIDQAHISLGALDEESARRRIEQAESQLEAHPELPQSAWLMAELAVLRASLLAPRPDSFDATARARAVARTLEGRRAATYQELEGAGTPESPALPAQQLKLEGLSPMDEVTWDGKPTGAEVEAAPGRHHVQVHRRGTLAWAGWVELKAAQSSLVVPVEPQRPCSAEDFGNVAVIDGKPVPPAGVLCPRWVLARKAERGSVEIAMCRTTSCGRFVRFGVTARRHPARQEAQDVTDGWPAWATYVVAGAGVVVATGLVLAGTGAFSDAEPGRTVWVFDGLSPPGGER